MVAVEGSENGWLSKRRRWEGELSFIISKHRMRILTAKEDIYLKRGVNDRGRVANDVETEQIVLDEEAGSCKGKMSSVVQMRGSIPLFWSQEASRFSPKPDIILQRYDPTYEATKLHFEDLAKRYGNPIIVLNLIKTVEKRPREMMLRREFTSAVGYLNQILSEENQLKFIHWDFHKFAKRDASLRDLRANSGDLARIGSNSDTLNAFIKQDRDSDPRIRNNNYSNAAKIQSGVLRTNCIDCLDRTNVAQYAYGLAALGRQLHAMGLTDEPKVDSDSSIAAALMDMYQSMGDALAQQYGGSAAHNTEGKPALWELDSDYYLHVSGIGDDLFPENRCAEPFIFVVQKGLLLLRFHLPDAVHQLMLSLQDQELFFPLFLLAERILHRKYEESNSVPKVASQDFANGGSQVEKRVDGVCELNSLSAIGETNEEDVFR
ncbi:hypothetical protein RJ639_039789, partial [Escallonia herrerae]